MPKRIHVPKYRHHKASGQAIVTLSGRDIYLGPYGTQLSRDAYDRVIGEWLAAGRTVQRTVEDAPITVADLALAYLNSGDMPASHAYEYRAIIEQWVRLYGKTSIAEFGPLALKVVRQKLIGQGLKRATVNCRMFQLRRIVKWGVSHELVEPDTLDALAAVEGLRAGQTEAPESERMQPVDLHHIEACIAHMPPMLAAMVRVQLNSGMRAAELCQMRTGDIDTSKTIWSYIPAKHKTQHHGHSRQVALGPHAIEALKPWLLPDLSAYIFSPARAEEARRAQQHRNRVTPLSYGNRPGSNRVKKRKIELGDRYTTCAYRRAIEYAIDKAFPLPAELARHKRETRKAWRERLGAEQWAAMLKDRQQYRWTPHQLRHTFAQRVRNQFGLEHTQRALGHATAKITKVYAQVSFAKATEVAQAVG
ncbi:MAG: tyrosine-type recombinase/integrase [Tepidisphaeraceae bacterium]